METASTRRPDAALQRPSLTQIGLWAVVCLLAATTALIASLVACGVLFEPQATEVDRSLLPVGTPLRVFDSPDGPVSMADCPALVGRSASPPSWCGAADASNARAAIVAAAIALVAAVASVAAGGRAWRCIKRRRAPAAPWPPSEYHQEGMPWGFWLGIALVGLMALTLDLIFVAGLLGADWGGGGPAGAMFWTAILVTLVSRYGRRSAFSLKVDGDQLVWRAPLRTVRVPLAEVAGYDSGPRSMLGERPGALNLAHGTALPVSVPNRRHELMLGGFLTGVLADRP